MPDISIDPRISIVVIPDGEIHIMYQWTLEDLAEMAKMFMAVKQGNMQEKDARMALRMRSKEGVDFMIAQLIDARIKLWGTK